MSPLGMPAARRESWNDQRGTTRLPAFEEEEEDEDD
jgi:hypothetical protein